MVPAARSASPIPMGEARGRRPSGGGNFPDLASGAAHRPDLSCVSRCRAVQAAGLLPSPQPPPIGMGGGAFDLRIANCEAADRREAG